MTLRCIWLTTLVLTLACASQAPPVTGMRAVQQQVEKQETVKTGLAILDSAEGTEKDELADLRAKLLEFQKANNAVDAVPPTETAKKAAAVSREIQLAREIEATILERYIVTKIDFVEVNNANLTSVAETALNNLKPDLNRTCAERRPIRVYGFGCYLGSPKATLTVSNNRSQTVRNWIIRHTSCTAALIDTRGFGLAINQQEVEAEKLTSEERDTILSEARHAVLYINRR